MRDRSGNPAGAPKGRSRGDSHDSVRTTSPEELQRRARPPITPTSRGSWLPRSGFALFISRRGGKSLPKGIASGAPITGFFNLPSQNWDRGRGQYYEKIFPSKHISFFVLIFDITIFLPSPCLFQVVLLQFPWFSWLSSFWIGISGDSIFQGTHGGHDLRLISIRLSRASSSRA